MLISMEAKTILCRVFQAQHVNGGVENKSIIGTTATVDGINDDWEEYISEQPRRPLQLDMIFNRLHSVLFDIYLMYNIEAYDHLVDIVNTLLTAASEAVNEEGIPAALKMKLARHGLWAKAS